MKKSIIEQELERRDNKCINDHCDICTKQTIQKALEELKKKRICIAHKITKQCKLYSNECHYKIYWSDVEKCFEVKDAKNK